MTGGASGKLGFRDAPWQGEGGKAAPLSSKLRHPVNAYAGKWQVQIYLVCKIRSF